MPQQKKNLQTTGHSVVSGSNSRGTSKGTSQASRSQSNTRGGGNTSVSVKTTENGRTTQSISRDSAAVKRQFLEELTEKNDGLRIYFLGSSSFRRGDLVIASFPGQYGKAWTAVMGESVNNSDEHMQMQAKLNAKTACVFLPDSSSPGYGEHDCPRNGGGRCYCQMLQSEGGLEYGCGQGLCMPEDLEPAPRGGHRASFGCRWFSEWIKKVIEARDAGCKFLVVYKKGHISSPDGRNWRDAANLGRSQNSEVRFLAEQLEVPFATVSIVDFVGMLDVSGGNTFSSGSGARGSGGNVNSNVNVSGGQNANVSVSVNTNTNVRRK